MFESQTFSLLLLTAWTFPQQPEPKLWCSWALGPQAREWRSKGYRHVQGEFNLVQSSFLRILSECLTISTRLLIALRWWSASPECLISQGSGFYSLTAEEKLKTWYFHSVGNSFLPWCSWKAIKDRIEAFLLFKTKHIGVMLLPLLWLPREVGWWLTL